MPDDQDDDDDNDAADVHNLQPQMRTADDLSDQSDVEQAEEMSDDDAEAMFVSPLSCCRDRASHGKQQLNSADLRALDTLLPPNSGERRTLADVIFSKLENSKPETMTVIQKVQQGAVAP